MNITNIHLIYMNMNNNNYEYNYELFFMIMKFFKKV